MKKKQAPKKPPLPQTSDQVSSAEWVRDMQSFYNRNGFYHPQDLEKLLGNPADAVETEGGGTLQFASRINDG